MKIIPMCLLNIWIIKIINKIYNNNYTDFYKYDVRPNFYCHVKSHPSQYSLISALIYLLKCPLINN